ncbi:MAG: hypothetical protein WDN30_04755 [Pararobbsia sp.]
MFSNDLALDNAYGRSFALMGATGDTVKNSVSDGSQWMGIVAGTDSNSRTMNGSNDTITHNLILNAKGDAVDLMGAGGALSQGGAGNEHRQQQHERFDIIGARLHARGEPRRPQPDQRRLSAGNGGRCAQWVLMGVDAC